MYVYVYVCIFTHISTYINRYIDFIVYTHIEYIYVSILYLYVYLCIYIYSNDTYQKNNILSLVKVLKKKKVHFKM